MRAIWKSRHRRSQKIMKVLTWDVSKRSWVCSRRDFRKVTYTLYRLCGHIIPTGSNKITMFNLKVTEVIGLKKEFRISWWKCCICSARKPFRAQFCNFFQSGWYSIATLAQRTESAIEFKPEVMWWWAKQWCNRGCWPWCWLVEFVVSGVS